MDFVPAIDLVRSAFEGGFAVPSFCVWNAECMDTVLRVAADCRAPVILMNGPGEFGLLPPATMGAIARAVARPYAVPAALHLDHGDSMGQVESCLSAGYTSVMLDFSAKPLRENIAALRRVVALAHPRNATVEGEIGAVGRVDEGTGEGAARSRLTDPDEARRFVRETGIDMVAVSIGNAHGNYPTRPTLDFDLLARLREATGIPLVLHGGSGTPAEDLRRAIGLGIAKVNVASELVRAVRDRLLQRWGNGELMWAPMAFADAREAMAPVVENWIHRTAAAGKA